jgi:Xaa-Pro aminopeptidase
MGQNRDLVFEQCQPEQDLAFSEAEFEQRLQRIRERMERDGIDVLWLMAPESLYYVSGYKCIWYQAQSPKQWPATSGIAIHREHDDFILFDTPSEAIMCRFVTCAKDVRVFPMGERRDGISFIVDELKSSGWLDTGVLGMELHSYRPNPVISQRFQDAFAAGGMSVRDGSDVLREVRWVKSDAEIACMEKAAQITDIGFDAAKNAIRAGVTELDVYAEMNYAMARAGGEHPGITLPVNSGLKANCGHALASRRKIQAGEQVNIDISGVYERYHANGGRAFYVGQPPKDVLDYHRLSSGVFDVIDGILRTGTRVSTRLGRQLCLRDDRYRDRQGARSQHRGQLRKPIFRAAHVGHHLLRRYADVQGRQRPAAAAIQARTGDSRRLSLSFLSSRSASL